ncbi:Nucleic acid dioxygenase alkbh1 [Homalodisca vitripennis]|nr:Nucleic acid dioxygenase alkbh1 [Homalodisca vitripennis]
MFKREFKYYKSRCSPPLFDNVLNFDLNVCHNSEVTKKRPIVSSEHKNCSKYGLVDVKQWKIFEFLDKLGLIFIVNPFTNQGQQYWVEQCLQEYTKKPNKLNIDPFKELQPGEELWETAQKQDGLLKKLRWATLGYHHNWDTKEYSEKARDEFPPDLAELSRLIVRAIGDRAGDSYRAEAAIINFYHLDSTLSGHKDVSEPNMTSPLLSVSFGQSAIFLVGGDSLDDPVKAMFLHSGDIVVMSGPARCYYHGIPRIVPTHPEDRPWVGGGWELTAAGRYLDTSRINMNVRQVLLPGEESIKR